MCTVLKSKTLIGRNFDYDLTYDEELIIIPKKEYGNTYSIIGVQTGKIIDYPLLYDGMNEQGLICCGLAFTGNAHYPEKEEVQTTNKILIPTYQLTFQILSNFKTTKEVKKWLKNVIITNEKYNNHTQNSELHWFVSDKKESIIIEQTKDGLQIYNGEVMTNNPPYNLMEEITKENLKNIGYPYGEIVNKKYYTRGYETNHLDGSYTSMGRFERVTYLKTKLEQAKTKTTISDMFHLLSSVEQIYGATPVKPNNFEYTIYSIIYDMENKRVWVKTYDKICPTNYLITNAYERIKL